MPLVGLVVPGADGPGGGQPAQRLPAILTPADVETAIDQDVEGKPAAGAEFEYAYAAREAIPERHQPHPGDLLKPSDAPQQLGTAQLGTEQLKHLLSSSGPSQRHRAAPAGTPRCQWLARNA
jgi:hypothetical protein